MLEGFEEETKPLTEYEEGKLLPAIIKGLKTKLGKEKAITNKAIVAGMREKGYEITEVRVRKIINHIRTRQLISGLLATSAGYYVSNDPEEIRKYISSVQGRIDSVTMIRVSLERYLEYLTSPR